MIEVALPLIGYPALERVGRSTRRGDIVLEDCRDEQEAMTVLRPLLHTKALLGVSVKTFKAANPAACWFSKGTLQRVRRGRG